jgi:hypothetical protein
MIEKRQQPIYIMPDNEINKEQIAVDNKKSNRLAWRLDEVSGATGLSIPFLRKEIRNLRLKARKRGRCVIVMDSDLQSYLSE